MLTYGHKHSVLNVKALVGVGAFNQEKALVGAFSVIVKTDCETDRSVCSTTGEWNLVCPPRELLRLLVLAAGAVT